MWESGFQCLDIFRRFITGDYDLFSKCMKVIESMEELFLSTFFTYYKLDIVNQQNINVPVFITEVQHGRFITGCFTIPQGINQFVGERLTGYI